MWVNSYRFRHQKIRKFHTYCLCNQLCTNIQSLHHQRACKNKNFTFLKLKKLKMLEKLLALLYRVLSCYHYVTFAFDTILSTNFPTDLLNNKPCPVWNVSVDNFLNSLNFLWQFFVKQWTSETVRIKKMWEKFGWNSLAHAAIFTVLFISAAQWRIIMSYHFAAIVSIIPFKALTKIRSEKGRRFLIFRQSYKIINQ